MGLTTDTTDIPVDYGMPAEFLLISLILPTYEKRLMRDLVELCRIFRASPSRLMMALDMQGSMQTACMASELEVLSAALLEASRSPRADDVTRVYPAPTVSCLSFRTGKTMIDSALVPAFPYEITLCRQSLRTWASDGVQNAAGWVRIPNCLCYSVRCRKRNPAFAETLVRLSKTMINVGYSTYSPPSWMSTYRIVLLYRNDETDDYLATGIHSLASLGSGDPMTLFYNPPAVTWPPGEVSFSLLNLINLLAHCTRFHSASEKVDSIDDIVGRPRTLWGTLGLSFASWANERTGKGRLCAATLWS